MKFSDVVKRAIELLRESGRVTYRTLKREFDLDDDALEDLKFELIEGQELAVDKDGKMLVWTGTPSEQSMGSGELPKGEVPVPSRSTPAASSAEAERRQLTVMFCDLVGSTALSTQLDPEELREVVQAYQGTSTEVIQRYEGHIAQHLGDGLLVYFGYPAAHEDDARRAVRAGLEIVEALKGQAREQPLQVRIGIHTGLVVVGEIGAGSRTEQLALGETPTIAARIQGQASPDELMISAATYRLVEGLFACEERGQPALKGIATPLTLYRVVQESEADSRFEAAVSKGLTPLVGREEELGLLRRCWEQAKAGEGQVILLSGEPGIGKSRLVQELKEQLGPEEATRIEFRCSPYYQNSALYPVTEHLQRVLGVKRDDADQIKLGKLEQTLSHYWFPQADTLPLLAALLSLPHPEGVPPLTLSPEQQKEKTLQALVRWLCEEAERHVVYCAWEDLHWADPSTLELLGLYLDQVPTARMLALLTFRPEFMSPWGSRAYLSQLTLGRLGRLQVERIVENVIGGKTLPDEVVEQVVAKTDGVPLFVEELTKTVIELGFVRAVNSHYELTRPLSALAIPATLHDSLMARLDRLAEAKGVAQLGATLGREFSYEMLHAVSSVDEATLQRGLARLVDAELVYQRGLPPHAHYLFKHALVQDTAYQSLLKSTRQQLHRQTAQVLEDRFPETTETQPELVAHHYTEAGLIEQALPYWLRAGERATQRSAYVEAISHLTRGLEVLKALSDTPEHVQQELTLQLALNDALLTVKGYTAPEVEKTVLRARELCQQLGETPQLFPVLIRLVLFYMNRQELQTTRELSEQLMRLAQSVQDQYHLSLAHGCLGATLSWLGELTSARSHLEQAIALYDPQQHPRPTVNTADPRVDYLFYASRTLWYLGHPEQALKRNHEALALARGLSHPFTLAYALVGAAVFHLLRREEQLARERAEEVITLSTEHGFPNRLAVGTLLRGWALAEQGQVEEGIAQMRQSQVSFLVPYVLPEAYGKVGQVEEGLSVLAKALAVIDKTGWRVTEAELYRVKGTLTLQQENQKSKVKGQKSKIETDPRSLIPDPQGEAQACFLKGIDIARKQQAKSWELRAATSLARLWQQQGKREEAHSLLLEIYGWFTEGLDTKDLQEAKALLEKLTEQCHEHEAEG